MMSPKNETNKLDQLITELKVKYELLYDAVQPIPYIRDRMFCVDKVFVEGGIEYLEKTSGTTSNDIWKPLASYCELVDMIGNKSKRQIVEGEPGYGKSTLTLQLAYDWCNNICNSPISKVKVLVFLRLRQLGGVQSIYDGIRKFILAKDSKLTEDDVKSLLNESGSVLLILDGYDEYPDQDNMDTDVSLIIKKDILRDIDVILTTRSSYLPKHRVPQTSRVRLRGFDETARDRYIRKAVVGDNNDDEIQKIKLKLKQNSVLGDLCEVPLFFVLFAHMTHESEDFKTFHSVTGFFRYMISCFHSHLRNKMRDENVQMSEAHGNDHSMLDEVAFEALSGYRQKIVWKKEQLLKIFGEEFYNHYIRVGILVEDDVLDCDDIRVTEFHAQYIVEVRFYHKLFCEWYAAHYLARNVSELSSNADQLLGNLDPFDLQYVYRFACGLNKEASEYIVKYLQRTDEGQKFAILCILEQEDNMQNCVEIVTNLVSKNVEIHQNDSKLLQRSTLQILEFASKKEIPITCLNLNQSYKECEECNIVLHSDLILTYPSTLQNLKIELEKDEKTCEPKSLSEEEIKAMFQYVLRCRAFKKLSFGGCLLPPIFSSESIPAEMQSRDIKVYWNDYGYSLNLQSGIWEVDDVDTVKRLCTEKVNIYCNDSELLQRCTIKLLENASYHDIPISCLNLIESFSKIDAGDIILHSRLRLSCPATVKNVVIYAEELIEMTETEVGDILMFVQRSRLLESLEFFNCLLPSISSSKAIPAEFKIRDIKVLWRSYGYSLNLQSGAWEVDVDTVQRICAQSVSISSIDSDSKQRCTIQLLENASDHDIPISCLFLWMSFSKIDAGSILLYSGQRLSCPVSVKKLEIDAEEGRVMAETEVVDILMFVQQSHMLEELKLYCCLLPQSIPAESIPSILKSRNVKVSWGPKCFIRYNLNLQSGRWMDVYTRKEITDTEYNDEVRKFRENWKDSEWQKARVASV